MPKASAVRKTPAKPAARQPAKPAATSSGSKAAQAAQHQGRTVPAEPIRPATPPPQPGNAVARTGNAPLPVDSATLANLPAFMRQDADAGKTGFDNSDLEIPRLKLVQGTNKELQEFDELRAGHFFHPAAEFIFDAPFRAVPIFMDKRYLLWNPLEAGGGILARADDGVHWSPGAGSFNVKLDKAQGGAQVTWTLAPTVIESGLANWGTMNPADPNSPPAATLMYNFLLGFPDEPDLMPAVLSFQRSSIKSGRRFLTKLKTQRAPLFGTIWEFSANPESRNGKDFFTIAVKGAGLVDDEAQYNGYRQMHEQFGKIGLSIKDIEGLQGETGEDTDAGAETEQPGAPRY